MIIVKFMDRRYEVVPDTERNFDVGSSCENCCFKYEQRHRCNEEKRMSHEDGSPVQGCVDGEHFYRKL